MAGRVVFAREKEATPRGESEGCDECGVEGGDSLAKWTGLGLGGGVGEEAEEGGVGGSGGGEGDLEEGERHVRNARVSLLALVCRAIYGDGGEAVSGMRRVQRITRRWQLATSFNVLEAKYLPLQIPSCSYRRFEVGLS